MAAIAGELLKLVRMGHFDDFGITPNRTCAQMAPKSYTKLNAILGFDSKAEYSECGFEIEVLSVAVSFGYTDGFPDAQLSLDSR